MNNCNSRANRPIRVGMVGVGSFGAIRWRSMLESGLFDLVAAYDRNQQALSECCRETGAIPVDSYQQLLETPGIEAMFISTGAKYHAEQGVAAAEAGLHCFIEKPLASTRAGLIRLIHAQQRSGVVILCGHRSHQDDPVDRSIKQMIDNGQMGKLVAFEATTAHSGGFHIREGDWRGDPEHNPGGMLFHCGVHKFHDINYFLGPIQRITATMRYDLHTTRTADVAVCIAETRGGIVGTVSAFHVTPHRAFLALYGTRSAFYRNERPWGDGGSWLQRVPESLDGSQEPLVSVADSSATDRCASVKRFYRAIRCGEAASPSLKDGALAVLPVFAAEESARTGRPVEVPSFESLVATTTATLTEA